MATLVEELETEMSLLNSGSTHCLSNSSSSLSAFFTSSPPPSPPVKQRKEEGPEVAEVEEDSSGLQAAKKESADVVLADWKMIVLLCGVGFYTAACVGVGHTFLPPSLLSGLVVAMVLLFCGLMCMRDTV